MGYRYQTEEYVRKIMAFFTMRPLIMPALLALLVINIHVAVKPVGETISDVRFSGYVRHIDYYVDGTAELEIMTHEYGRLLYKTNDSSYPCLGQSITVTGDIYMPDPPSNPGEFDYAGYLHRRGIRGIMKPDYIEITGEGSKIASIASFVSGMSFKTRCYALSFFEGDEKGLAAAVFTGDTTLLDDDVSRAFRLSNCSHLLAVSGTHFSGFLMILASFISASHMKKKHSVPLYIVFCVLVGTFTGWTGSVTRASVMSICAFMSRDLLSGMSLATILIFAEDPYGCLSLGYMMSFAASLSIHYAAPKISALLERIRFPKILTDLLAPVLSATIGMMPFWGRNCYYFSFFHLGVQIIGSFIATVSCVFFIPSVITGLPFACTLLLKSLYYLMSLCSSVSFDGPSSRGLSDMFIKSLFVLVIVLLMPDSVIRKILMPAGFLLVMAASGFMAADMITAPDVTVIFIDVGQGDSCLIIDDDCSLLIDGGVENEGRYSVASVLDYYGIGTVDIAVATHMDEDHIGGINYLDSEGRIECVITCRDIRAGDNITMPQDVVFNCVWPHEFHDGGNEDSIVLRMECGSFSILYTGDIGFDSEYSLISEGALIDSDILKVGHHGSAYSTSTAFLEAVSPQTAIISVVRNSPYGHPARQTMQRLGDYGCEIRRTDLEGAIIYELSVSE